MTAIIALVSGIVNKFSAGSNEVQNGAAAVRQAIGEVEGLQEADFTAVLGEPEIVDNGNVFFTDPKVAVPVKESPYDSFDRLMFDLPRGRTDEESAFFELLDFFGLDFETMEQLEDGMIPVFYAKGCFNIDWDNLDNGEEENPDTENDSDTGTDEESDSAVNVEETTINSGEDEDA
jgi:hypothetical protein